MVELQRAGPSPKKGETADNAGKNKLMAESLLAMEDRVRSGEKFSDEDAKLLHSIVQLPEADGKLIKRLAEAFINQLDGTQFNQLSQKWAENFHEALGRTDSNREIHTKTYKELTREEIRELKRRGIFREIQSGQRKIPRKFRKMLDRAKESVSGPDYVSAANDVEGYVDVRSKISFAVEYWVIRNKKFKESWDRLSPIPPPQVFILKGNSGSGKTTIAKAAIREAVLKASKKPLPVTVHEIDAHGILEKYVGEPERKLGKVLKEAMDKPSIILLDEAQGLTSETRGGGFGDNVDSQITGRINDVITKALDKMKGERTVLILTTNMPGIMSEAIRRRAAGGGIIDLDQRVDDETLVKIASKLLKKYKIDDIDPHALVEHIKKGIKGQGRAYLTPADISNQFAIASDDKMENVYAVLRDPEASKNAKPIKLDMNDLKNVAKLKEYSDGPQHRDLRDIITKIKPTETLADVGGLEDIKGPLYRWLLDALDPTQAEEGRSEGIKPTKGVLLTGPPGTGKTHLTKAVVGELAKSAHLDVQIITIKGSQLHDKFYGETSRKLREVFAEARKHTPAIIFIDEIDAIAASRSMQNTLQEGVNTLLTEMDGPVPLEGVVVIGTTNRPDMIDDGFKRPGRFDRIIEITPPKNDAERREIIAVHLKKAKGALDPSITPQTVLSLFKRRTFTPAGIERIVSDAIQLRRDELTTAAEVSKLAAAPIDEHAVNVWNISKKEVKRLYARLGITGEVPASIGELKPEVLEKLRTINKDNYKLTTAHFSEAVDQMRNLNLEEARRMMADLRSGAAIGKVYGLTATSDGRGGGSGTEGVVTPIECYLDTEGLHPGTANVNGSEIDDSIKVSAKHGMLFLDNVVGHAMRSYEFNIELVSPSKGADQKAVSGPSAGAAITLSEYSRITGIPVTPEAVITGGMTQFGEIVKVGGLDYRGMGKIVAALNTSGVKMLVMPESNYNDLSTEEKENLEKDGLKLVPAKTFWDVTKAVLGLEEQQAREALAKAIETERLKLLKREEQDSPVNQ